MKSKWDENKEQKEESLFDTAYRLFLEKGFNQTTISDIVNMAGVAKGTFYLYFKDKYDIRDRIIIRKTYRLIEESISKKEIQTLEKFEDRLLFIVDFILDYLSENKAFLSFMHRDLIFGIYKGTFSKTVREGADTTIMDLFTDGAKESGYQMTRPDYVFCLILELVSTVAYSAIVLNEPAPIEEMKPYVHRGIMGILSMYKE